MKQNNFQGVRHNVMYVMLLQTRTSYFIGSVLHLSCQVIYHQPGPGEILSTDLQSWPPQSLLEKETELDSVSDDHSYLLTVEADGGDCVGVLSIFQTV